MLKKIIILILLVLISGCKLEGGGSNSTLSSYDRETLALFVNSSSGSLPADFDINDLPPDLSAQLQSLLETYESTDGEDYPPLEFTVENTTNAPVPEPATLSLLGLGLAGLLLKKRKTA